MDRHIIDIFRLQNGLTQGDGLSITTSFRLFLAHAIRNIQCKLERLKLQASSAPAVR